MFFENDDKSYTMVDLYLNDRFLGYKDSYNYYDIDVDKILLFRKSYNKYIIRYHDVNKMKLVPLQLKRKNFFWVNYIHLRTILEQYLFTVMIKNFLENVEKYGIRLLN